MNSLLMRSSAAAAAMLALAMTSACDDAVSASSGQPAAPAAVEVGVVTLQAQRVAIRNELPGRTSAYRVAEVRPQVGGIVIKRLFREGGEVQAGQQLYQINPAPYQAALDSAKAELAKAQASLKAARLRAERYTSLVRSDTVSRQSYDDAISAAEQGEAQVAAAKAAVETAQINLDYTKVYSPIAGRTGKSTITEGALVTASQAQPLVTVTQLDPIYVDVTQSSSELLKLRRDIAQGRLQGADATHAPVNLLMENGGPYPEAGQLQFSEVTVDQSTGSVRLRALFPNPRQDLLPGMFVRGVIQQAVRENGILVPQQAVLRGPDGSTSVWVVADGKANPRPVAVSEALADKWLVDSGLAAGEQVVVDGLQKIRPGVPVKAIPLTAAMADPSTTVR